MGKIWGVRETGREGFFTIALLVIHASKKEMKTTAPTSKAD